MNFIPGISEKFNHILAKATPFVFSYPPNWKYFDLNPFDIKIPPENHISCIDARNERFFDLLHSLDGLAFGPVGMPMDKWVFFDCGEMPGGIFGFGLKAKELNEVARKEYKVDLDYPGIIPISMYIAIPMVGGKMWFGHNLSSANRVLDGNFSGLGLLTKAIGLKVFKINTMLGATQWDSKALHIHLQLDDVHLESAYTPAHTFKNTMTYRSEYSDEKILRALSGVPREAVEWDFLHPSDNDQASMKLQERITENGEKFSIVGRPVIRDGKVWLPMKQNQ